MSLPFIEIQKPRESARRHSHRPNTTIEEPQEEAVNESDQDPDDVLEEYYLNGEGEVDLQRAARQRLRRRPVEDLNYQRLKKEEEIWTRHRRARPHRPVGDHEAEVEFHYAHVPPPPAAQSNAAPPHAFTRLPMGRTTHRAHRYVDYVVRRISKPKMRDFAARPTERGTFVLRYVRENLVILP